MTEYADLWWRSRDGLKLHARDYAGAGGEARSPVIAIHGLTRNAADFHAIAPRIAATTGRRVLALDVRGRGLSERASDPMTYQPQHYARDVVDLFEQAGIARGVFLGTSMGGLITMALSVFRARLIAAAILNDVGPEVSPVGLGRIAAYAGKPVDTPDWDAAAAYVKTNNAIALPHYTDADWAAFARRTFREGPDGTPVPDYDPDIAVPIVAAGKKALVPSLWPFFRRLARKRPTLLVRGATSDLLSPEIAARMRQQAPRMDFVEVPGVGHAPMLDEPAAQTAILDFLGRVP